MKIKLLLTFLLLSLCGNNVFSKATTDLNLGFICGYQNFKDNWANHNPNLHSLGFGLGCDVEITNHIGVFLIGTFYFT